MVAEERFREPDLDDPGSTGKDEVSKTQRGWGWGWGGKRDEKVDIEYLQHPE